MKIKLNRTERGRAEDWRFLTEGRRVMPSPDSLLFYKKGKKYKGEKDPFPLSAIQRFLNFPAGSLTTGALHSHSSAGRITSVCLLFKNE